jgi:AcrR family transcriptional regulator
MAGVAGQGRKFGVTDALDAATLVFWEHGYEGASLKLLTEAMGINPPSLYKAFGSKEELFFAVIDHYNATHGRFLGDAFAAATSADELVRRIVHGAADHYARPGFPGGCLTISAAVTVTPENTHVAERLAALRNANVARIADALAHDVETGALPSDAPIVPLASFVGATLQGMSQQARDGANAQALHAIADLALVAFASWHSVPRERGEFTRVGDDGRS